MIVVKNNRLKDLYYFYNSENNECLDICLYNPTKKNIHMTIVEE